MATRCEEIKLKFMFSVSLNLTLILEAEHCDSLLFLNEANGRVLVYLDNLSLAQPLPKNVILKDKAKELESTHDSRHIINQAAVHIKSTTKMPRPPKPNE